MSSCSSCSSLSASYLQPLEQRKHSSAANTNGQQFSSAAGAGVLGDQASSGSSAAGSPLQSGTLAALLSLQEQDDKGNAFGQSGPGLFARLDADGDGQISKDEFKAAPGASGVETSRSDKLFDKFDVNGDGSISQDELIKAKQHGHIVGASGVQDPNALAEQASAFGSQLLAQALSVASALV